MDRFLNNTKRDINIILLNVTEYIHWCLIDIVKKTFLIIAYIRDEIIEGWKKSILKMNTTIYDNTMISAFITCQIIIFFSQNTVHFVLCSFLYSVQNAEYYLIICIIILYVSFYTFYFLNLIFFFLSLLV